MLAAPERRVVIEESEEVVQRWIQRDGKVALEVNNSIWNLGMWMEQLKGKVKQRLDKLEHLMERSLEVLRQQDLRASSFPA
jgi:hypothetical protein